MVPELSIVVVHWNVPALLDDCLRSIAHECAATPDISTEMLVVDCASPSETHRTVVARHDGVRLIALAENRGYAAGCNAGIAASDGRLVLLLNPDILLEAGVLGRLCHAFEIAEHIGMTAPILRNADGSLQSAGYAFPRPHHLLFDLLPVPGRLIESPLNGRVAVGDGMLPIKIDYPLGAAMCVRRRAIDDVGPLDEGYGMYSEEIDWARRFADHGWTTLLVPDARMVHLGGQSTGQQPTAMRSALWASRARYGKRWWSKRDRRLASLIVAAGTRLRDFGADAAQREENAQIRSAFSEAADNA